MKRLVFLLLFISGCAGILPALQAATAGAGFLGTVIDLAETGANTYYGRHPHQENEVRVNDAVLAARRALAALEAVLATGEAASKEDAAKARREALAAYSALKGLLDGLGVSSATPPAGGAEVDGAPKPEPFGLPSEADMAVRLGL